MSKFGTKTILTSEDGLEYQETNTVKIDEKKISFMTLQEQILEQEKMDTNQKEEVTKVERKNATKPSVFDRTYSLPEEESGFKQEIFNEEDFDYFQYYGQLREIEDRNIRREREEIEQFKQQRSQLVQDNSTTLIVAKNPERIIDCKINIIKIKKKEKEKEKEKEKIEESPKKKIKMALVDYDDE